ncbi:hypothetical protein D915_010765 [Fasciola hepatica]|uniref:Uncharacterized protein n=1 Tax=Fasciola hepatica TaxID=6192 RepID=A0A4E0QUG3_FASHE|nr:hypothetical protein D915_010765 [Fasciola hepatica]
MTERQRSGTFRGHRGGDGGDRGQRHSEEGYGTRGQQGGAFRGQRGGSGGVGRGHGHFAAGFTDRG